MDLLNVRNVNDGLLAGLRLLRDRGRREESRNGPVLVAPGPVVTRYENPVERVLFAPERDANPFFHLYESLWMLAGSNELKPVNAIVGRLVDYSDDGFTLRGAYGYRWRKHFGFDQLVALIAEFKRSPRTRRGVLVMYDPKADSGIAWKDVPCNTHIYFRNGEEQLDITVCCRSNDAIWGAYGANAVHFSVLQEVVASAIGARVGTYYQVSNNFHAYLELASLNRLMDWAGRDAHTQPYEQVATCPLIAPGENAMEFVRDCERLVSEGLGANFRTNFLNRVVVPMLGAHRAWRSKEDPQPLLDVMELCDWKIAATQWIDRRMNRGGQ